MPFDSPTTMAKKNSQGALVLCGGKSTRMGDDKANMPFGSETMLQRVVRLLTEVVEPSRIVVVAAQNQAIPTLPASVTITRDRVPGRGPLEGFSAGLEALPSDVEEIFITSCDAPLLVPAFVRRLFELCQSCDAAVPTDGKFVHPLSAVYRTAIRPHVNSLIASNQLRVNGLFNLVRTRQIPIDDLRDADPQLQSLENINTPDSYRNAKLVAGIDS